MRIERDEAAREAVSRRLTISQPTCSQEGPRLRSRIQLTHPKDVTQVRLKRTLLVALSQLHRNMVGLRDLQGKMLDLGNLGRRTRSELMILKTICQKMPGMGVLG